MRTILLGLTLLLFGTLTAQTNHSSSAKADSHFNLANEVSLLQSIRGNWFRADMANQWEYGIYNSVCILQNRICTNKSIRKQGQTR